MNVYLPAESVKDEPRHRFLDWRFLAALAVLVLLAFLVYAGFRNYEIREAEAAQKDALIVELSERAKQIETLERDIARLTERAREDRKQSSEERATLLRHQKRMIRLLQRFGITPPTPPGGSSAADPAQASSRPSTVPARDNDRERRQPNDRPPSDPPSNPAPPAPPPPAPEPPLVDPPPFDWLPDLPELPAL